MQKNLYRIFDYYLSRNKIITKTEVKNIVKILLFNRNLLDNVNCVLTSDYIDTQYVYDKKELNINISKIVDGVKYENKEMYKDILSKIQLYQKYNLDIFKCILHEIEHVDQWKKNEGKAKTLEDKLISASFEIKYINNDLSIQEKIEEEIEKEYLKIDSYYYSEPTERMAYINSGIEIVNIAKFLGLDKNIIDLYMLEVLQDEDTEYEIEENGKIKCPLKKYISIKSGILKGNGKVCYEEYLNHDAKIKKNKIFKLITR